MRCGHKHSDVLAVFGEGDSGNLIIGESAGILLRVGIVSGHIFRISDIAADIDSNLPETQCSWGDVSRH